MDGGVALNSEDPTVTVLLEALISGSCATSALHWARVLWQAPISRVPRRAAAADSGGLGGLGRRSGCWLAGGQPCRRGGMVRG